MALPRPAIELPPQLDGSARATGDPEVAWLDLLESLAEPVLRTMSRPGGRTGRARTNELGNAGAGFLESLVFLRLAEERGLERRGTLGALLDGPDVGARLAALLVGAAERYDVPGLARGPDGTGHEGHAAALSGADEGALRDLLFRLCDSDCLGRLHPAVLGRLYERSLAAKTPARTRTRGRSETLTSRARRQKRKTHGVFYTPAHVVDYVILRTLGRALAEQGGADEAPRVLDPACGSGAFLLGAYEHLLDFHRAKRGVALTVAERTHLLASAIFGVDVDETAIEVAKLSLLLVCFDAGGEKTGDDRVPGELLPALGRNLWHGHSLLDVDWKGGGAPPLVWHQAFPRVFADGGFDVVIGNPPYLSFGGRHAVEISDELRRYYAEHYESGGWPTAHSLFLERAVKLLSRRFVAFVVPDQLGHLAGYRSARTIAQREAGIVEVRYWGERVFRGVTTPALTLVLDKTKKGAPTELVERDGASRPAVFEPGEPWSSSPAFALIDRLRRRSFSLDKLVGDCGIRTTSAKDQVVDWPGAAGSVVPVLEGKLVGRYGCRAPASAVRLDSNQPLFVSRIERYEAVRFVIRQTASYPIVGPREHAVYFRNSLLALFSPASHIDVHYLVALLNSKLLRFVYTETIREAHQRAFPQVKVKALQSLPLRTLDVSDPADKRRHDHLVDLARRALTAQKRKIAAQGTRDETISAGEFDDIDRAIDEAVYDLYELSPNERDTVERSLSRAVP